MFKDYIDVRNWLENFIPYTYSKENLGLERIRYLLKLLGNPQKKFKSIHVAGTSGKGSTAFYIAKLLQSAGSLTAIKKRSTNREVGSNAQNSESIVRGQLSKIKIGLHLSPHLTYIGERMQILKNQKSKIKNQKFNGEGAIPISKLIKLFNQVKQVVEKIKKEKPSLTPSYFEILVAASFLYFAQEKVDWAVVEVGLGGRLDATNVLQPQITLITNVGLDHTEILGKTVEKIATEKAGIIKGIGDRVQGTEKNKMGVPVVTGTTGKGLKVIEKVAKQKKAQLIKVNTQPGIKSLKSVVKDYLIIYKDIERYRHNPLVLSSGLLAIATVSELGFKINRSMVRKAFVKGLSGRFEEIDKGVVLDGAHNVDKIRYLIKAIKNHTNYSNNQSIILVAGFKIGKEWKKMLELLVKNLPVKKVIATRFYAVTDMGPTPSERLRGINRFLSVEPDKIVKYVNSKWKMVNSESFNNSQEAVFEALRLRSGQTLNTTHLSNNQTIQLVLVTGSLYLVGEVRTMWQLPSFT